VVKLTRQVFVFGIVGKTLQGTSALGVMVWIMIFTKDPGPAIPVQSHTSLSFSSFRPSFINIERLRLSLPGTYKLWNTTTVVKMDRLFSTIWIST